MNKIRVGVIGMGFIGACHIDALRRIPYVECVAVSDVDYELAKRKAEEYFIPKCYQTVDELIADPEINVIHNCTTNNAHREINEKVIRAGKHIFSEKPLAMNSVESQSMLDLCAKHPEVVHGINHCYRMTAKEIKAILSGGRIKKAGVTRPQGGYAIKNITERLKLIYGDRYSLHIKSKIGHGTRIELRIPKILSSLSKKEVL